MHHFLWTTFCYPKPHRAQDFVDNRFTEYCTKLHDRAERNMSQAAEIQYITPITKKAKVVIEGGEGEEEEEEGAPNLDGEDETGFLMFTWSDFRYLVLHLQVLKWDIYFSFVDTWV